MDDGTGLARLIPPLKGADFLEKSSLAVPCIIRNGSDGGLTINGTRYTEPMPSFTNLDETDLSNLINYINTAWGNDYPPTNPMKVQSALSECD